MINHWSNYLNLCKKIILSLIFNVVMVKLLEKDYFIYKIRLEKVRFYKKLLYRLIKFKIMIKD